MLTKKFYTSLETILSSHPEPLSDGDKTILAEANARIAEQWAKERLDQIFLIAINNKSIARDLCITATQLASSNDELINLIKDNLKKNCGRPNKWTPHLKKNLLIHYAGAMTMLDGNHKEARNWLIDYESRMLQTLMSDEAMENLITKAIGDVRQGKLPLSDLPEWAQPIIQARMNRGTKTLKRTNMRNRNKP